MKNMEKKELIKELIKEDHWHNIPIENTTNKIFSIIFDFVYLVQDKKTLINHGIFSTKEKAINYTQGNYKYSIKKCKIE
jgi:nucleoid DNA-binding protein